MMKYIKSWFAIDLISSLPTSIIELIAYEDIFNHTSTSWAPWYIIPADHKWFMRLTVADIICAKLKELNLKYPTVTDEHKQGLIKVKELLENEK